MSYLNVRRRRFGHHRCLGNARRLESDFMELSGFYRRLIAISASTYQQ